MYTVVKEMTSSRCASNRSCCISAILTCLGLATLFTVISIQYSVLTQLQTVKSDLCRLDAVVHRLQTQHQPASLQQSSSSCTHDTNPLIWSNRSSAGVTSDAASTARLRVKRSLRRRRRRRSQNRRTKQRGERRTEPFQLIATQNLYHPSAHMSLIPRTASSGGSSQLQTDGRLRWTSHGGADSLMHNNAFRFDSDYDELVVQSSGTYFVYLQLTYNGRTIPNFVRYPTCSHKLLLRLRNTDDAAAQRITLLHTSMTQYRLGRELWERTDGIRMAAFDSSFTAGVFPLEAGDALSVQPAIDGATCSVISHHDQTFIGAVRLQLAALQQPDASASQT